MNKKRTLSLMLAAGLIVAQSPVMTKAAEFSAAKETAKEISVIQGKTTSSTSIESTTSTTTAETTTDTSKQLETVLKLVKSKIKIPDTYSIFEYNYQDKTAYSKSAWNFNWYTKDYKKSIYISSDDSGNIQYFSKEDNSKGNSSPKYTSAELKDKAESFIKTATPSVYSKLKFSDVSYSGVYSGYYLYSYERLENGIPMPDNSINVGVDAVTGEVKYFSAEWLYDIQIPEYKSTLSEKEAAAKIGDNIKMQLMYLDRFDTDKAGKTTVSAYLVYAPDLSYIAVDAKSGKIYTTKNLWLTTTNQEYSTADTAFSSGAKLDTGEAILTEAEQKKIEESNQLISKDKALSIITNNKSLLLDSNAKSITSTLNEANINYYNDDEKRYVWNITFTDPTEPDYKTGDIYRPYTYATVDAKTGEILSFYASVEDYYSISDSGKKVTTKTKYTEEACQKIFETFAKTQNADRFQQVTLSNVDNNYILNIIDEKEIPGGFQFNYNRVNEGVEYSSNYINGAVDGVTGKITSYGYSWFDNVKFESPKNVISAAKAFDAYISFEGFDLVYEINTINTYDTSTTNSTLYYDYADAYSVEEEVRLVYRTAINPIYVSPFTGKQLDSQGEVYTKDATSYKYTDISGHSFEKSIQILSDMGAGFKGGNFDPDKAITNSEFQSLYNAVCYRNTDYELVGSSPLTREKAAYFAIQSLDLDYIAKLNGIFKLNAADESSISTTYYNYVALANGLGILTMDSNNNFKPTAYLTRAEAADMILKLLAVNN